ncbi:beta-1,6-N-acetylglucosaminyltransferase [Paenibacillus sp. sgz500958]|uniref:beta-1,6-N-acetylglucosaminyltransferase n=1 Tax=Paenibacillus sp. sgz500958 TaxID=3242475 RepID=UPI0036D35F42
MKLAVLVLAHKQADQIKLLIHTLKHEQIHAYIHVDGKNDRLFRELLNFYENEESVTILPKRVAVNRGGFTQIQATLLLMEEALKADYDYVALISGQCLPIKGMSEILDYLQQNNGKQFLEGGPIGRNYWRLKCYNFFSENEHNRSLPVRLLDQMFRLPQKLLVRRKNLPGLELYKGSSWFTVTGECAGDMLEYIRLHPEFLADFRYTYSPEESFFHILAYNGPYKHNIINNDLMEIDWASAVNGSPRIYRVDDYEMLKSSPKLFARKFDMSVDEPVIRRIAADNEMKEGSASY